MKLKNMQEVVMSLLLADSIRCAYGNYGCRRTYRRTEKDKTAEEIIVYDPKISVLSSFIESCRNLVVLDVTDTMVERLPLSLKACKHLEVVRADRSSFQLLPPVLWQLPKIKRAFFSNCRMRALPLNMGTIESLEVLDLSKNTFTELIPECLGVFPFPNIRMLDVSGNKLTKMELWELKVEGSPACTHESNIMTQKDPDGPEISVPYTLAQKRAVVKLMPKAGIQICPKLEHYNISNNKLTEVNPQIAFAKNLKYLDFSHNTVGWLPTTLINLRGQLEHLLLDYNACPTVEFHVDSPHEINLKELTEAYKGFLVLKVDHCKIRYDSSFNPQNCIPS